MKSFGELSAQSRGKTSEETKELSSEGIQRDAIYQSWVNHPHTRIFLEKLEDEVSELTRKVIDSCASAGDYVSIQRVSSKIKTLEGIINYGRGNDKD